MPEFNGGATLLVLIELLGGLGMFLYGLKIMSDGIHKAAGQRMKRVLSSMTSNPFFGVLTGLLVTCVIQSSSATTVMLVSLVNAGLISLVESIGVVMGANIGTTLTAWLVSLLGFKMKIVNLALPAIAIGFPFYFSKFERKRDVACMLIGFGLLFLGLDFMKDSVPDIKSNPEVLEFLQHFSSHGYLSILFFIFIGTLLTVIIQSSSASMAITIVMTHQGWIEFPVACAIVLGENIGTTITAFIASLPMNTAAKRTARAHMLFNLIGVAWMLVVFYPFLGLIDRIVPGDPYTESESIKFHLSMFHTLFNITNTVLLVWCVPVIARIVTRWVKEKPEEQEARLDMLTHTPGAMEPTTARLLRSQAALMQMGNIVQQMLTDVRESATGNLENFRSIRAVLKQHEESTDRMQEAISHYLTRDCMTDSLTEPEADQIHAQLRIAHELESIADALYAVAAIFDQKVKKDYTFHEGAVGELAAYLDQNIEFMNYNLMFLNPEKNGVDLNAAKEMEDGTDQTLKKLSKVARKQLELQVDTKGELAFLDIIRLLEHIGDNNLNISQAIRTLEG